MAQTPRMSKFFREHEAKLKNVSVSNFPFLNHRTLAEAWNTKLYTYQSQKDKRDLAKGTLK